MIVAFSVCFTVTTGGVDVGGGIVIETPVATRLTHVVPAMNNGIAPAPHVALVRPGVSERVVQHELRHLRQWSALGPAFVPAYALTAGHAFEDYRGDVSMWEPPPELERSCPVVRYDFDAREMMFMPCWRFP